MLNAIRPFRFSNKISKEELFKLVDDRESQNEEPFAPWIKIILNKDVWLYCLAWFCACFNLAVFTIFPQRYYQLFLGTSIAKITKVFGVQGISSKMSSKKEEFDFFHYFFSIFLNSTIF